MWSRFSIDRVHGPCMHAPATRTLLFERLATGHEKWWRMIKYTNYK
jgi:hypothetical protein